MISSFRSVGDRNWLNRYQLESTLQHEIRSILAGANSLTVLDLGCGSRKYEKWLEGVAKCYVGTEVAPVETCDVVCVGENLPFDSAIFDIVLCTQVLEHVSEPDRVLREIARVLKPGAVLLLSTHGTYPYHPNPVDHWRWTHTGLQAVLERAKLRTTKIAPVGGTFSTLALLNAWYVDILAEIVLRRLGPIAPLLRLVKYLVVAAINLLGLGLDRLWKEFKSLERPNTMFLSYVVVSVRSGCSARDIGA